MEYLRKTTPESIAALMLFFAQTVMVNDDDYMEIRFIKRKGGKPATWKKDFSVSTTYGEGLYLGLLIKDEVVSDIFDHFKKFMDIYAEIDYDEEEEEEEFARYYEFRITDTLEGLPYVVDVFEGDDE